jgi:uncharacterized repeat protein (TIGR03803 family)
LLLAVLALSQGAYAQELTDLVSFNWTDGGDPANKLIQGTDGNLYGTTYGGGTNNVGTVFKITPDGGLTVLYNFCWVTEVINNGTVCIDGANPAGPLAQASDGNFYGVTSAGGINGSAGTVFAITPAGELTTLYNFCFVIEDYTCMDGGGPQGGLVLGHDGNLYGTTYSGGPNGGGAIFKITLGGVLKVLNSLSNTYGDGSTSWLTQGTDGNFYGIPNAGGNEAWPYGCGSIFRIAPDGAMVFLHEFDDTDGSGPGCALAQSTDGNFYGTTFAGGAYGAGTVFKITPTGAFMSLYNFCPESGCADGSNPQNVQLIQDTSGSFYGATSTGGTHDCNGYGGGCGTIFKITPSGEETVVHDFDGTGGEIFNYENMRELADKGITHVVSLQNHNYDREYVDNLPVSLMWHPIPDDMMEKPPSVIGRVVAFCLLALEDPKAKIYIHCAEGRHRSP